MFYHITTWGYRIIFLVTLTFSQPLFSQQTDSINVLFVGNSYTYFWNLPQTLNLMVESQGAHITTSQSTAGGSNWQHHWNGERQLKSKELIKNGHWDFVVLQNHSLSTVQALDQFLEYGEKLIELVRNSDAIPVLYITWAREHNPLMQKTITSGYLSLGKEHKVTSVPVGPIWSKVKVLRSDLALYDSDQSHPSPIGTYLNGLIFYKFFTGLSVRNIPNRLQTTDKDGEKLYISILSAEDADFLQQVVDEFDFSIYEANRN